MKTAREDLLEREREIIRLIAMLLEQGLNFIVVGGYAVSTYQKRFSIDLDIVISGNELEKFEDFLKKRGYSLAYEKKVALLYGENFKRYEKTIQGLPIDVDLLINGLVSRTTDATWSFDYINKNASKRKLDNLEFLTPIKELLIAMKLHSGRLSDVRDIVALMPCDKNELKKHLLKGNIENLAKTMKKQYSFLEKPQFDDSFKGVFGIQAYKESNTKTAKNLFNGIIFELKDKIK